MRAGARRPQAVPVKLYPTDPRGELDLGLPERTPPCAKRTWCLLAVDHTGSCVEVPRVSYEDRGPKRRRGVR